jgi:hypothetical protein
MVRRVRRIARRLLRSTWMKYGQRPVVRSTSSAHWTVWNLQSSRPLILGNTLGSTSHKNNQHAQ